MSLLFFLGYLAGASAEERGAETPSHELLIVMSNGNRTEWGPIWSVIIRVINKIGRPRSGSPICLITTKFVIYRALFKSKHKKFQDFFASKEKKAI